MTLLITFDSITINTVFQISKQNFLSAFLIYQDGHIGLAERGFHKTTSLNKAPLTKNYYTSIIQKLYKHVKNSFLLHHFLVNVSQKKGNY